MVRLILQKNYSSFSVRKGLRGTRSEVGEYFLFIILEREHEHVSGGAEGERKRERVRILSKFNAQLRA